MLLDPTEAVIHATFCGALGIFALAAAVRPLLQRRAESPGNLDLADEEATNHARVTEDFSFSLGGGRVATHLYQPLDLLGIGCIFLVFYSLTLNSARMAANPGEVVATAAGLISSIGFLCMVAGLVTALVIRRIRPVAWLGLRWPEWRWVFVLAPAAVLVLWFFFAGLDAVGYAQWIESLGVEMLQDSVKLLQTSKDPQILSLMIIAAVIVAPVCEEIVFRGYLYPIAKRFAGPWVAGICSAMVFAVAHGSVAVLVPLLVMGVVLVFIYEKTGSLWAPIAVHLCFNGATVIVQLAARYSNVNLEVP